LLDLGLSGEQRRAARSARAKDVLDSLGNGHEKPQDVLAQIEELRTRIAGVLSLRATKQDLATLPPQVAKARTNLLRREGIAALSQDELADELRKVRQAFRTLDRVLARVEAAAAAELAKREVIVKSDHEIFVAKLKELYVCKELKQ
jgi:aminopeptidase N